MPRFAFDPATSMMTLDARSTLHPVRAETIGLAGWIEAEVVGESGQAEVEAGHLEIPMAQLSSGNGLYDAELHRIIDVRRYPVAEGVLSDWQPTELEGTYRVRGQVSFSGVSRQLEDHMTLSVEDERTVILEGSHVFDVRDFGITPPGFLGLRVHPEVTIRVAMVGHRIE